MKSLDHLNLPLILMVDNQVREVGRIDIDSDWKFTGWISPLVADVLQLETNLGSIALNPHDDYIATDKNGVLDVLNEYHDEQTMAKVLEALTDNGCTVNEAQSLINSMKHAGILFRERKSE